MTNHFVLNDTKPFSGKQGFKGLLVFGFCLLRAPRGSDLAAWDSLPEGGLDQGRGLETGGLSDRTAWWKSQKPFLVEKFHKKWL